MRRSVRTVIFLWIFLYIFPQTALAAQLLVPGGQLVGLELSNDIVTVAAFDDSCGTAARDAGLQIGDQILSVDGTRVSSAREVREILAKSRGEITLLVLRGSKQLRIALSPVPTPEGPRLGVYLRQGIAGIGTVTFYDPESHIFGTLGHSVSDAKGNLLHMRSGTACEATVASVKRGKAGDPGQLRGNAAAGKTFGTITRNTPQGVFGTCKVPLPGEPLPVAAFSEVHTGAATIRSTVQGGAVQEYSVEILKIYPEERSDCRNFLIRITDPALIAQTGGIVQGMSGSPIIQDGKLVGAVTHVLVNSPDTGYGIFIENMLDAAS